LKTYSIIKELRVAIATGLIQPGSKITISGQKNKRPDINNVEALQQKLNAIKNKLDWTERLDLTIEIVNLLLMFFLNMFLARRK
jgi:hypothetical protein